MTATLLWRDEEQARIEATKVERKSHLEDLVINHMETEVIEDDE